MITDGTDGTDITATATQNGDGNASPDDTNRDGKTGRWVKGCAGGPGGLNSAHRSVILFRQAMLDAVTPDDISRVMDGLRDLAIGTRERPPCVRAIREYLDRAIGRPDVSVTVTQGTTSPQEARTQLVALLESNPAIRAVLLAQGPHTAPEGLSAIEATEASPIGDTVPVSPGD